MIKTITLITLYFLIGLTHVFAQIEAGSIPSKLSLVDNPDVKVLRTAVDASFEEIRELTTWKWYDSTYTPTPKKEIWLRFEMENRSKDSVGNYFYSLDHYVTIYQQKSKGFEVFKNGLYVPLNQRANKTEAYFTELTFNPYQKSLVYVVLRVKNGVAPSTVPSLYSERGYWKLSRGIYNEEANSIGFIYFYIISLVTIFMFALIFWLRLRERIYLFYLGYLFFQIIYGFLVLRSTLAPIGRFFDYVPKLSSALSEPVQFTFIGFYIFFILYLLQIKNYDRLLAKILYFLGVFCFAYALSRFIFSYFFYDPNVVEVMFATVRLIILPVNFILIFWIIYKVKHPLLPYFIVGQVFFFIGAILASYIGYVGAETISDDVFVFKESANIIFQLGLLIEVYCFSLALGINIFLLRQEKEKTDGVLIEQLQENQLLQERMNIDLDKKVNEKTEELIQLYTELEREKEQKIKDDFNQRLKETEMVALRSQMNPHFIFNSLTAIKYLIMASRNEYAISYLDDFSSLLRGILQNSNRKKITVEEELEILQLYLSLEQNRMGEEFIYDIQCTSKEELSQYEIPPLLLQPIVENAIWHGLHPSLKIKKKLTVIFDTSKNLKIIIEDNGVGRKESAKRKKLHNSMGTKIVYDRLTLFNHLNNPTIDLKVTDLEEGETVLGTRITLTYEY